MGILNDLYVLLRIILDFLIDFCFGLYYNSKKQKVPPVKNKLVLLSACELATRIRVGELRVTEVVNAFIERSKEVNGYINAIVSERYDAALVEAKKLDEEIASGRISDEYFGSHPFLGIPFTTKESSSSTGLRWTFGLVARKNIIAETDAEVVRLLKTAGGIQIGVTNVPQLNMWAESYNPVYGICKNPHDTTKNTGGSTGGDGSIIAACGVPIGIGSDLGGSIRIPSMRCGIFGHKPTPHTISNKGLGYDEGDTITMSSAGPMAKRCEDLLPLLKVLLGSNLNKFKLDQKTDIKNIKIYYQPNMKCPFASPIRKEMKEVIYKAVDYLKESTGNTPTKVVVKNTKHALPIWLYKMGFEECDVKKDLTNRKSTVNIFAEVVKFIFGQSDFNCYTFYNLLNVYVLPMNKKWAKVTLENLKKELLDLLQDNGVLIFPSEPYPASYHHTSLFRPYNLSYYALFNALEFAVTQVPMGLNKNGMPIGLQVVTTPYNDHLSILVAKELERGFGGYTNNF